MMYPFIEASIIIGVAALLCLAALSDVKSRRIPNALSFGITLLFAGLAGTRMMAGSGFADAALFPFAAALSVFIVLAALFAFDMMGGGDVKLMSATALIAGPALTLSFSLYVAVAGGVIALLTLMVAKLGKRKTTHALKVPYGVAIAFAGLWVCIQQFPTISI